jgi:hypothetical protein
MFRSILLDKESWIEHVMLDPETGLDPPGIKLRAVRGKYKILQLLVILIAKKRR